MPNFIPYDHNQTSMIVINFLDQIQPGTFEHAIHHLIEHRLDLTIYHPKYRNDATGRRAYDPAILLKIILFAYSKGITSSREIQWCCENNITFMALACNTVPHFTTIASFVSGYSQQIETLFEQILLICHEDGLLASELFAIDGCKLPSNAAKEWSGYFKELTEKRDKLRKIVRRCVREHKATDKRSREGKERAKRTEQKIETLNRAADRTDEFLRTESPKQGQGRTKKEIKSNVTDNESAR